MVCTRKVMHLNKWTANTGLSCAFPLRGNARTFFLFRGCSFRDAARREKKEKEIEELRSLTSQRKVAGRDHCFVSMWEMLTNTTDCTCLPKRRRGEEKKKEKPLPQSQFSCVLHLWQGVKGCEKRFKSRRKALHRGQPSMMNVPG